jgi:hypothetical protein
VHDLTLWVVHTQARNVRESRVRAADALSRTSRRLADLTREEILPSCPCSSATQGEGSENGPACALVFFGQVKNFEEEHGRNTVKHLVRPLMEHCSRVDVFLHTSNQSTFHNPRNQEAHVPLHLHESLDRLRAHLTGVPGVRLVAQEVSPLGEAERAFRRPKHYLKRGDPWPGTNGLSLKYFLRQLHSLRRATALWSCCADRYALVLYARPDLQYDSSLPLTQSMARAGADSIEALARGGPREDVIFTPEFGEAGGFNDRLALGGPQVSLGSGSLVTVEALWPLGERKGQVPWTNPSESLAA